MRGHFQIGADDELRHDDGEGSRGHIAPPACRDLRSISDRATLLAAWKRMASCFSYRRQPLFAS